MNFKEVKLFKTAAVALVLLQSYIVEGQNLLYEGFEKEKLVFFKEKSSAEKEKYRIERNDRGLVVFSFFEEFNDTLVLFLNGEKQGQWVIHKMNNPAQSSGYSGISYSTVLKKRKNIVVLKLLQNKKYVEFKINKRYPLYSLQRYGSIWYVNARKYAMILK